MKKTRQTFTFKLLKAEVDEVCDLNINKRYVEL